MPPFLPLRPGPGRVCCCSHLAILAVGLQTVRRSHVHFGTGITFSTFLNSDVAGALPPSFLQWEPAKR